MKQLKTGALIAMTVGGLFSASACKKEDKAAAESKQQAAPKADEAGSAANAGSAAVPGSAATPGSAAAEGSAAVAPTDPGSAAATDEKTAQVDCYGVNACKGQGTCKTEKHGCGGQNACKGQGVLTMSESDCNAKGGKITARK